MFAHRQPGHGRSSARRLLEGALFGEMALLTAQPRTASVQVVGEADLLEVGRDGAARAGARRSRCWPSAGSLRARAPAQEPARDVAAVQAVRPPAADGADPPVRGARRRGRHRHHPRGRGRPGAVRRPAGRGRGRQGRQRDGARGRCRWRACAPATCSARCRCSTTSRPRRACDAARRPTILFLARDYFRRLVSALPDAPRVLRGAVASGAAWSRSWCWWRDRRAGDADPAVRRS